jgi:hypothetical protein
VFALSHRQCWCGGGAAWRSSSSPGLVSVPPSSNSLGYGTAASPARLCGGGRLLLVAVVQLVLIWVDLLRPVPRSTTSSLSALFLLRLVPLELTVDSPEVKSTPYPPLL